MNVGRVSSLLGAAFLVAGCIHVQGSDDIGGSDRDLIGGDETKSDLIPATIGISQNGRHSCTAARVGPRQLLTAAHCVFSASSLSVYYDAEHDVTLRSASGTLTTYKVKEAHVHPEWAGRCADTLCSVSAVTAKLDAPDVAVIELADEPKDLATAKVDRTTLSAGDVVRVTGFGCTTGVHVTDENVAVALRTAEQKVVPASAALHEGSFVNAEDEPVYSGNYAFTAGAAGLCPGDSGGPLYRATKDGATGLEVLAVVGVNANYTLLPDEKDAVGIPVTNWHTRLDGNSRNHVGDWLSQVGVP